MKNENELTELKVEIRSSDADLVNDALLALEDERWSILEDAIVRRAWIIGIFDSQENANGAWSRLAPAIGTFLAGEIELRTLGAADWKDSYKAHFHAWKFGRLHWVPVWQREKFDLPEGDAVLWLDPGMAFGTGNHETTRLCVERLVKHAELVGPTGRVIDAGCGSGILALSAAKLGFSQVVGFDNDPEAVRVSEENAALNGLSDVRFFVGDLQSGLAAESADVLLVNILANVLIEYAKPITDCVARGGILVLSGILTHECQSVWDRFATIQPSWRIESNALGDWSDLLLRRPANGRV